MPVWHEYLTCMKEGRQLPAPHSMASSSSWLLIPPTSSGLPLWEVLLVILNTKHALNCEMKENNLYHQIIDLTVCSQTSFLFQAQLVNLTAVPQLYPCVQRRRVTRSRKETWSWKLEQRQRSQPSEDWEEKASLPSLPVTSIVRRVMSVRVTGLRGVALTCPVLFGFIVVLLGFSSCWVSVK